MVGLIVFFAFGIGSNVTASGSKETSSTANSQSNTFQPLPAADPTHPVNDENKADPTGYIYLTFDDGPTQYTQQLLDILAEYRVRATFFVTDHFADYIPLMGDEAKAGHTVAAHTYSHDYAEIYSSVDAYFEDLERIQQVIESNTGKRADLVRLPGGTNNEIGNKYCPGIMPQIVAELDARGIRYCDWNASGADARNDGTAEEVANSLIEGIKSNNNTISLQHDTKGFSVEAVEQVIQWGIENGYVFKPIEADTKLVQFEPVA